MEPRKSVKQVLKESGLELFSQNPVEKVTVKEIAANAGVSTRAFYNHFRDKMDFLLWIYIDTLDEYIEANKETITFSDFIQFAGDTLNNHQSFYYNTIKYMGQNNFKEMVFTPFLARFIWITENRFGDKVTPELCDILRFYCCGLIEYVARSFATGKPQPVSEAMVIFRAAAPRSLEQYF